MNMREQIQLVNTILSNTLDLYRLWAKQHDLNYNALLVLYTLYDEKQCTQKQICGWWALPKQTVHGILHDFEKEGYVTVMENEENKRERLISFTEKGQAFADSILQPLHEMEETAMEALGEDGRNELIDRNQQYYEHLKREIEHGN